MLKHLPFGISLDPEYFQKKMDEELSGIECVKCRVADILVIGSDQAEHDQRLKKVLDRLVERKVTINLEKCLYDVHDEGEGNVNAVLLTLPASNQRLDEIRSDAVCTEWVKRNEDSMGQQLNTGVSVGNISLHSRLLLRGQRIIIPPRLRADVLKTRANAASSMWWPEISQENTKVVQNSATCEKYRRERIEPMKGTEFPDRPLSRVAIDFFQHEDKFFKRCRDMPRGPGCELFPDYPTA